MVTIKIELGNFDSENQRINYSERFTNGKKFVDVRDVGCDQTENTVIIYTETAGDKNRQKYTDQVTEDQIC